MLYSCDSCADGIQSLFNVLITPVYLLDVVEQAETVVMTDDDGAVRVAQDDLRPHVDELVHEEQAAFKHLLVDEHAALRLGGHDEHHAQQVGRQSRPRRVGDQWS